MEEIAGGGSPPATEAEEERYVEVASRFYRVRAVPVAAAAAVSTSSSRASSARAASPATATSSCTEGMQRSAATTVGRSRWTWTRRSRRWLAVIASCRRRLLPRQRRRRR